MPIDYKKYPPNWKDEIRPAVLKKYNYKCGICGVGQRWQGYREISGNFIKCDSHMRIWAMAKKKKIITIFLSIAHLDHDITNNTWVNLKPMCQKCHNNYDQPNRKLNRLINAKNKKNGIK